MPEEIIRAEIRAVLDSCGDLVQTEALQIGDGCTLDHIIAEGFDAVLIAMGLSTSVALPGTTRPRQGVIGALEFLEMARTGGKVAGSVLVLGGGNTAIDAALSAMRSGAADVSIVYRRSFAEMPAWPEERDLALRSGINFLILTAPLSYVEDQEHRLTGLRVVRTRLGEPGADGRRQPVPVEGSEHVLPADLVVEAIGQRLAGHLQAALAGLRFTSRGLLWTQEGSLATSRRGVFAAGDIVNGGTTVVQAVAEGTRAAREIDAYLSRRAGKNA